MKIRNDVTLALATVAGALVALFALFVTIPVWLTAVVITLTAVGAIATVSEIVKAYKASYNEETEKHTYKFPVGTFVFGTLILVALASIILLALKRLFGFALIPVAALLAVLLVIAFIKKLRIMKCVVAVLLAVLIVAIVGYFTSALVHSGVNLNPGVAVETTGSETETETSETTTPETEVPETEVPETEVPETEVPETTAPETDAPQVDTPVVETPETEAPETDSEIQNPEVEENDEEDEVQHPVVEVQKPEVETEPVETDPTEPEEEIEVVIPETTVPEVPETEVPDVEVEPEVPETTVPEVQPETPEVETEPEEEYTPVTVKINAPETLSYAEPITITLEGIKAENLKFGNEDFLSIVIISDTEVEITLIGIVNDAGEVEIVPAAGYITVTDSVTGVHVAIEIVE